MISRIVYAILPGLYLCHPDRKSPSTFAALSPEYACRASLCRAIECDISDRYTPTNRLHWLSSCWHFRVYNDVLAARLFAYIYSTFDHYKLCSHSWCLPHNSIMRFFSLVVIVSMPNSSACCIVPLIRFDISDVL